MCCGFFVPATARPGTYLAECAGNEEGILLPPECGGCQGGALHVVPCVADCNRDGQVTVEELVRAVGVVAGAAADGNEDGAVALDEVVRGVRNVLTSCLQTWMEAHNAPLEVP